MNMKKWLVTLCAAAMNAFRKGYDAAGLNDATYFFEGKDE